MEFNTTKDVRDYIRPRVFKVDSPTNPGRVLNQVVELSHGEIIAMAQHESEQKKQFGFECSWYGAETWEGGIECLTHGSAETFKSMKKSSRISEDFFSNYLTNTGSEVTISDEPSGCVDVGAYIQGDPECFLHMTPTQKKVVHLAFCLGVTSSVSTESIESRGMLMLSVIEALESRHYGVRLTAFAHPSQDSQICAVKVCIKEPEEYIAKELLAQWLCSPSAYRMAVMPIVSQMFALSGGSEYVGFSSSASRASSVIEQVAIFPEGAVILPTWDTSDDIKSYAPKLHSALKFAIDSHDNA